MVKKIAAALVLGLAVSVGAAAQVHVYGQLFLPDGNLPAQPIRFYLTSDDGLMNEYRFTDSNGRFILERLSTRIGYTITVTGDGSTYGDTTYKLIPEVDRAPRITLNPLPRKAVPPSSTVSAASGYKPAPQVAALYDKAMKEVEKKHYDAAEDLLRQATKTDPKFFAPFNDLGVLLMQQKKYPEAEKVLRQALEADPKSVHALLNLGVTLNHLQKYADAIPPLREALRLEPGVVKAHLHFGIALVETDDLKEAEKELTRAGKSTGTDEIVLQLYLGKLYARTGDFEKSIAAFETYLQEAPNAANANDVRALIERMKHELAARH